ncbi:hypothetical protein [Gabonibacter chumensis]|uniref:hypothetical protein n=1 Tax=Gabonibacter chumensis TaxID=2972474 RepID=UPI0025738E89|nr:hypothetical protein [Gabonibacter chumensis]MCR9011783.1 hypothetical protein [Gabonibacter chumensis]
MKLLVMVIFFFPLLLLQSKEEGSIPVYVLIGKDSEKIQYMKECRENYGYIVYSFTFRDVSDLECIFIRHTNMREDYLNDTLIKSRSFLDSISYYDEKWLLSSPKVDILDNWRNRIYVIDTTSLGRDSIVLRRFDFSAEEPTDDVIMEEEFKFN